MLNSTDLTLQKMPILDPKCLTLSHLQQTQAQTGASDLLMLERCTLALELVGRLKQHGLEFIFKGGTSLLLHLPDPRRLSIDVDILCNEAGKLPEVLIRSSKKHRLQGGRIKTTASGMNRPPNTTPCILTPRPAIRIPSGWC